MSFLVFINMYWLSALKVHYFSILYCATPGYLYWILILNLAFDLVDEVMKCSIIFGVFSFMQLLDLSFVRNLQHLITLICLKAKYLKLQSLNFLWVAKIDIFWLQGSETAKEIEWW